MRQLREIRRRKFLQHTGQSVLGTSLLGSLAQRVNAGGETKRPKVAAIITEFTFRSHAHVILENFLEKYYFNGRLTDPGVEVASFYFDQVPKHDMGREVAKQYQIPLYKTINDALCLGGDRLAVDGVLSIAEFGQYPRNNKGQIMYPRKRFFDEIVATMQRSDRFVPLFTDKHLSYRWDWCREIYDTARRLNIPLMAGSSLPLAQRRPPLELSKGCEIQEAVSIHGGPLEVYDFHSMELLQSLIEARKGGETGVASVQFLEGESVWKAASEGLWDFELADAAMDAELGEKRGSLREFVEPLNGKSYPPHATVIRYRDGVRATVLCIGRNDFRWNFACRINGNDKPKATSFYVGPWRNRNLFKALARAIQVFIRRGTADYPVERTLLVSGMLDSMMTSRQDRGEIVETPELAIAYNAQDFRAVREMGASWKIITEEMPEPQGIEPGGPRG